VLRKGVGATVKTSVNQCKDERRHEGKTTKSKTLSRARMDRPQLRDEGKKGRVKNLKLKETG